jgi:hypothetical protein
MEPLIYDRCEAKTLAEIEKLEQRRAAIFQALQGLYKALGPLLERKPDLPTLKIFWRSQTRQRPKSGLLKSGWHIRAGTRWTSAPAAARSALPEHPESIRDLVAAFQAFQAAPRKRRLAQVLERRRPGIPSYASHQDRTRNY